MGGGGSGAKGVVGVVGWDDSRRPRWLPGVLLEPGVEKWWWRKGSVSNMNSGLWWGPDVGVKAGSLMGLAADELFRLAVELAGELGLCKCKAIVKRFV